MDAANFQKKAAQRLNLCFDMFEFGTEMMRQKLRRDYPKATENEIQARFSAWLQKRLGAEHGDGQGRRVSWASRER